MSLHMGRSVDLDALASSYRHRPAGPAALARARRALRNARLRAGDWAIDVGGGPGEHAAEWAAQGVRSIVVDPTPAMVRKAHARRGVWAIRARAERLPLAPSSAGLVYFHLSIHYGDWRAALREARRVLRSAGEICIWTLGPLHHATSIQAQYFPSVRTLDERRFPAPADIEERLRGLGFEAEHEVEVEQIARRAADWVAAVEDRFISTLQLITEDELADGIRRFCADHPDPDETVNYQLTWDHVRGRKL